MCCKSISMKAYQVSVIKNTMQNHFSQRMIENSDSFFATVGCRAFV